MTKLQMDPREIRGSWRKGYVLDVHTTRSEYLGDDEFGRATFHTDRTDVGESLYRLKYHGDKSVLPALVEAAFRFVREWGVSVAGIVPVPATNYRRRVQPVGLLANGLGLALGLSVLANAVVRTNQFEELKNVHDPDERRRLLDGAFRVRPEVVRGEDLLLVDDLYHTGATMNAPQRGAHGRWGSSRLRLRADEDEDPIMNTLFLGGSRRITRLAPAVRKRLDELIEESPQVLVGDANGADKAFQQYLSERRYPDVTVFSTLATSRNNLGRWPVEHVVPPHRTRDFAFFTAKDAEMARRADRALMLWDGRSAGTMVNVARLVAVGKPVLVYVGPRRSLRELESAWDLESLLDVCPPAERSKIDRRIDEHVKVLAQPSLF